MAIEYTLMLDTRATIRELAKICRGDESASDEEVLPCGVAFWLADAHGRRDAEALEVDGSAPIVDARDRAAQFG